MYLRALGLPEVFLRELLHAVVLGMGRCGRAAHRRWQAGTVHILAMLLRKDRGVLEAWETRWHPLQLKGPHPSSRSLKRHR